jgi:hypothetical protein
MIAASWHFFSPQPGQGRGLSAVYDWTAAVGGNSAYIPVRGDQQNFYN